MIAERTQERARHQRPEPRRVYSFERAGRLWMPLGKRLELLGGGPCGSFAARGGCSDDLGSRPALPALSSISIRVSR